MWWRCQQCTGCSVASGHHFGWPSCCGRPQATRRALLAGQPQPAETDANGSATSEARLSFILERSYRDLAPDCLAMFMDVAAALVGQPKEWAMAVWEAWHGTNAVLHYAKLDERCLLETDEEGNLRMHDVIRNVARGALLADKYPGIGLRRWWSKVENKLVPQPQQVRGNVERLGRGTQPGWRRCPRRRPATRCLVCPVHEPCCGWHELPPTPTRTSLSHTLARAR